MTDSSTINQLRELEETIAALRLNVIDKDDALARMDTMMVDLVGDKRAVEQLLHDEQEQNGRLKVALETADATIKRFQAALEASAQTMLDQEQKLDQISKLRRGGNLPERGRL